MPNLSINTSAILPDAVAKNALLTALSHAVASVMGKPEEYVMVTLTHSDVCFASNAGQPAAFCQLSSIGGLTNEVNTRLAAKVCELLGAHLHVPSDRVYIVFQDVKVPRLRPISPSSSDRITGLSLGIR